MAFPPVGFLYLITWVCVKSHPSLWKTWLNTLVSCPVYLWNLLYLLMVRSVSPRPCYYPIPARPSLALSQLCWFLLHTSGPLPAPGPGSQPSALTHDCQTPQEAVPLSTPLWVASSSGALPFSPHCFSDSLKYVFVCLNLSCFSDCFWWKNCCVLERSPSFSEAQVLNVFSSLLEVEIQHYYLKTSLGWIGQKYPTNQPKIK